MAEGGRALVNHEAHATVIEAGLRMIRSRTHLPMGEIGWAVSALDDGHLAIRTLDMALSCCGRDFTSIAGVAHNVNPDALSGLALEQEMCRVPSSNPTSKLEERQLNHRSAYPYGM